MIFKIIGYSYTYNQRQTPCIMKLTCFAILPSVCVQFWFFSWGVFIQIFLGCTSALVSEALVLKMRKMDVTYILADNSAFLSGLLLAISIPPLAPWWIVVLGVVFAIIVTKQLYGGLGYNIFNPAMMGYVMLLISFPIQMATNWTPYKINMNLSGFIDTLQIIFTSHMTHNNNDLHTIIMKIDGVSQATILNAFKAPLYNENIVEHVTQHHMCNNFLINSYWYWVNLSWLLGGLFLIWQRIIKWHIPMSFLCTIVTCATFGHMFSPDSLVSPQIHLMFGATMLGAFFILTDPVTASTTSCGRLIFGTLAGFLVWIIRSFGNYPDGVAFAVLLSNITVPIIDYYTRPRVYGYN